MTRRIKFLLIGLALVAFAVLIWFLVLNPIRGDVAETEDEIQQVESDISTAQIALASAEATRAEGRVNAARLLELAKMVPSYVELPSLILQIQDLADKAGIEWMQITPGEAKDGGTGAYQIVSLALKFSGTFFDVSDFIYRAEQMASGPGRLLAVKSLSLSLGQGTSEEGQNTTTSPDLEVAMTISAFMLTGTAGTSSTVPSGSGTVTTGTGTSGSTTQ
jgi:Tfp pilus assembly protein PilO